MRIDYAFIANAAEYTHDGKLQVLSGDFDSILAPDLPLTYPTMCLVVKLNVLSSDSVRALCVRLLDPDGESINTITVPPPPVPEILGDAPRKFGFVLRMDNLVFNKGGQHAFVIVINDDEHKRLPLLIKMQEPDRSE